MVLAMKSAEAFRWFIKTFVEKDRRERWLTFLERDLADKRLQYEGWHRIRKNSNQIENHFDRRFCAIIDIGRWDAYKPTLEKKKPGKGILIDFHYTDPFDPPPDPRLVSLHEIDDVVRGDDFLIYPSSGLALYFHDEGWVWECERLDARIAS